MGYAYENPSNRLRARSLLKRLLKEAEEAYDPGSGMADVHGSELAEALRGHISVDRLVGVHVYPAPLGGWHGDVVLDVPDGFPQVFGTPKSMPCETREEAIAAARSTVALILHMDRSRKADGEPRAGDSLPFSFENIVVSLPLGMLAKIRELAELVDGGPRREFVLERLGAITRELTGRETEMDEETFSSLPDEDKARLVGVLAMASVAGVLRFPEFPDAPPPSRRN